MLYSKPDAARQSMKSLFLISLTFLSAIAQANTEYFARYTHEGTVAYGQVFGETIQPIDTSPFGPHRATGTLISLSDVELMLPTDPQKVFAVGMNFASHLSSPSEAPPPLFLKLPTSLVVSGQDIHPSDAHNVHFEGELVLVMGKKAKNVSETDAEDYIFAVSVGNDLTERSWQAQDLQWLRSKASDGFAPISPIMAVGVDYNNVQLTTRLNGEIVQQESTAHMIHSPAKVVSNLSQYFTLLSGDLIFMGTPGRTQALDDGDVVSVTIEQVGQVSNTIRSAKH